jgi:hypothetical protein
MHSVQAMRKTRALEFKAGMKDITLAIQTSIRSCYQMGTAGPFRLLCVRGNRVLHVHSLFCLACLCDAARSVCVIGRRDAQNARNCSYEIIVFAGNFVILRLHWLVSQSDNEERNLPQNSAFFCSDRGRHWITFMGVLLERRKQVLLDLSSLFLRDTMHIQHRVNYKGKYSDFLISSKVESQGSFSCSVLEPSSLCICPHLSRTV